MNIRKSFILDNQRWYCLSLFYSREQWHFLLDKILSFNNSNCEVFINKLIFLSEERGEHIRLIFSTSQEMDETMHLDEYFSHIIDEYPSDCEKKFPFGKGVWRYHPNNSMIWNGFSFENNFIIFSELSSTILYNMLESDFSIDNTFSHAMFLCTKILKCLNESIDARNYISYAIESISEKYENHDLIQSAKSIINEYQEEIDQIQTAISYYWESDEEDHCQFYVRWFKEVESNLFFDKMNYIHLSIKVCQHFGLSRLYTIILLSFLQAWYLKRF